MAELGQARRILVYGVTGSGKSTTAARIAERTGLPLTLVDDLTWEPGWVAVDTAVQRQRMTTVVAEDRWVVDSSYSAWLDVVVPRVELIVGLDFPRWLSLQRLVRRSLRRWRTGEVVCNGNTESLRQLLSRDSIVVWHFRSFRRKRDRMRAWAASGDVPEVLLFSRPRELDAWLEQLGMAPARRGASGRRRLDRRRLEE